MKICSRCGMFLAGVFFAVCALQAAPDSAFYNCRIEGRAPGAEGRVLVWKADKDVLSGAAVELGRTEIEPDGSFTLTTQLLNRTLPTYFCIDYYSTGFIAVPGKTYRMEFLPIDYFADEKINAFVGSNRLPELRYVLKNAEGETDTSDLNFLTGKFSFRYQQWLNRNFENVQLHKDTASAVAFLKESEAEFARSGNEYFDTYRRYSEAYLKQFAGLYTRRQLYSEYIEPEPGITVSGHAAHGDFLKNFFAEYFTVNRFLPFNQTRRIIVSEQAAGARVKALRDTMGLDYAVRNERLREWVLLYGLLQLWDDERLDPDKVEQMVRYLADSAKFEEVSNPARTVLEERRERMLRPYFKDVVLRDREGQAVELEGLLQKNCFHYFVFVRAAYNTCPDCGVQLNLLQRVWEEAPQAVKESVKIMLINCDYTFAQYQHHARAAGYPWPYYHFNKQIDWIRRIDAARFPAFYLVDDKGNVLDDRAAAPDRGLDLLLKKIEKLVNSRSSF